MSDLLTERPLECLAPMEDLLATLHELEIVPASIVVEWKHTSRTEPQINVWIRYRNEFDRIVDATGRKTRNQSRQRDQRHYFTTDNGPMIQCMAFAHHDDWEA